MKKLLFFLLSLSLTASAQSFREEGYLYLYDLDHRIVVRDVVDCTSDYQDLWNGDYVRLINSQVFIYRGGARVTYGNQVWLTHTGDYVVEISGMHYLVDSEGRRTGVYGSSLEVMWNGVCQAKRGAYWYLYTRDNAKLGSVYSTERIVLYWNGYYCYRTPDGYYRLANSQGQAVNNSYSEQAPVLTSAGHFQFVRAGNRYVFDTNGNRIN